MALEILHERDKTHRHKVYRVSEHPDLIQYLNEFCGTGEFTLFRGQPADWPLLPKVGRLRLVSGIRKGERALFGDFCREAVTYLRPAPDNPWDWVAIAQHHGLPTRLLDWTKNPLAAAFFAVGEPARNENEYAVIWVFRPKERQIIREPKTSVSPFDIQKVRIYEPRHVSPRIRAQDAAFTVHPLLKGSSNFQPLEQDPDIPSQALEKLVIPSAEFWDFRYYLNLCGVHAGSLFPDLVGLAQHALWKHAYLADETTS